MYQATDAIGIVMTVAEQTRVNFTPTDGSIGKNSAGMDMLTVPPVDQDLVFWPASSRR